jgi:hypothetical protein
MSPVDLIVDLIVAVVIALIFAGIAVAQLDSRSSSPESNTLKPHGRWSRRPRRASV